MRRAISIDEETWERLRAYEGRTGHPWTVLLRQLLERWVAAGEPDMGPVRPQTWPGRTRDKTNESREERL